VALERELRFQSHIGPISTPGWVLAIQVGAGFQSHIGPISTRPAVDEAGVRGRVYEGFNPILVRFQHAPVHARISVPYPVSIPYWSDFNPRALERVLEGVGV